jgi:serine/threonine-protein kinase
MSFRKKNMKEELLIDTDLVWQDLDTGLIWQKKVDDKKYTWEEAFEYTKKLNSQKFGGYDDWRLPSVDELVTLFTKEKNTNSKGHSYHIKEELLKTIPEDYFWVWSNTEVENYTPAAWFVSFYDGHAYDYGKSNKVDVLCVADSNL